MITVTTVLFISLIVLAIIIGVGIDSLEPTPPVRINQGVSSKAISIIVPFRNETERIRPLLASLALLKDMPEVEVIFVDDHSEDQTADLIRSKLGDSLDFRILQAEPSEGSAKKAAIEQAIKAAKYYWIATLDADAEIASTWLSAVRDYLENDPDVLIGPIAIEAKGDLLGTIQKVEALGIQQLARGMHGLSFPIVANGANLIYKKRWFEKNTPYADNKQIASGDDMFLLRKAVKERSRIHYLNESKGVVTVQGEVSWKAFFAQRTRWLKKSQAVGLVAANLVGIYISLANFWILVVLVGAFAGWNPWGTFIALVLFKTGADFILSFYKVITKIPWAFYKLLVTNLVYPWLMLIILTMSLSGSYTWKGRAYKK